MVVGQDGTCGTCHAGARREPAGIVPLSIDHDPLCCRDRSQSCGRCTRGLLCPTCSGWLCEVEHGTDKAAYLAAHFPVWHGAAMVYLERHGCDPTAPYRRLVLREQRAAQLAALRARAVDTA